MMPLLDTLLPSTLRAGLVGADRSDQLVRAVGGWHGPWVVS